MDAAPTTRPCACGCGQQADSTGSRGTGRRYASGTCRNRALRQRKADAGVARKAAWPEVHVPISPNAQEG